MRSSLPVAGFAVIEAATSAAAAGSGAFSVICGRREITRTLTRLTTLDASGTRRLLGGGSYSRETLPDRGLGAVAAGVVSRQPPGRRSRRGGGCARARPGRGNSRAGPGGRAGPRRRARPPRRSAGCRPRARPCCRVHAGHAERVQGQGEDRRIGLGHADHGRVDDDAHLDAARTAAAARHRRGHNRRPGGGAPARPLPSSWRRCRAAGPGRRCRAGRRPPPAPRASRRIPRVRPAMSSATASTSAAGTPHAATKSRRYSSHHWPPGGSRPGSSQSAIAR